MPPPPTPLLLSSPLSPSPRPPPKKSSFVATSPATSGLAASIWSFKAGTEGFLRSVTLSLSSPAATGTCTLELYKTEVTPAIGSDFGTLVESNTYTNIPFTANPGSFVEFKSWSALLTAGEVYLFTLLCDPATGALVQYGGPFSPSPYVSEAGYDLTVLGLGDLETTTVATLAPPGFTTGFQVVVDLVVVGKCSDWSNGGATNIRSFPSSPCFLSNHLVLKRVLTHEITNQHTHTHHMTNNDDQHQQLIRTDR